MNREICEHGTLTDEDCSKCASAKCPHRSGVTFRGCVFCALAAEKSRADALAERVKELEAELPAIRKMVDEGKAENEKLRGRVASLEDALDLAIGFCVDFRERRPDWAEHPEVGVLFAKLTGLRK